MRSKPDQRRKLVYEAGGGGHVYLPRRFLGISGRYGNAAIADLLHRRGKSPGFPGWRREARGHQEPADKGWVGTLEHEVGEVPFWDVEVQQEIRILTFASPLPAD